jgi:NADH:ubiquinone oxidoreductase subunit F (NADH-binding)/(2Fe-2S) ferredoxin/Pyruvate/2-oxoacid:ferredoxin oxidoreductase delta subunit
MKRLGHPRHLAEWRRRILDERPAYSKTVSVTSGTCGQASGSREILKAFKQELERRGLRDKVGLRATGCQGFCEMEPHVVVHPRGVFYKKLTAGDVPAIIDATIVGDRIITALTYEDPASRKHIALQNEIPFYRKQTRLLTGMNFEVNPERIEDYVACEGYQSLATALFDMTAEGVIAEVEASGLRGRGGAGFPTGRKWQVCRAARGHPKYIVANGDEGDPGAYMDRSLLEGNPHGVIEGMIIGAYAIGASEGFLYVRREYPLAVKHVLRAIEQARQAGLLGSSILGSEFHFDIHLVQGAGAFVSGEETALLASIEGRRAFPRQRPPYPAQDGLWNKPTNINNVETWANVPLIIGRGAAAFAQVGTEKSPGTKIFSLVGKVNNTGLVEVPMGLTLREVVYDIGGGLKGKKKLKAVQTGGPSGGCLPANQVDIPVDYDALARAGAIMGSGGLIVMDEDTCMVDVARYFLAFTQEESCGKCVPCRVGTRQMFEILTRITQGRGTAGDIERLETLADTVRSTSLCGLGQTAPNPVLTTLRYFRSEYVAHIAEKSCPARVCQDLVAYYIEPGTCVGCLLCKQNCPVNAIRGERKKTHVIDQALCVKCGACFDICPEKIGAVARLTGADRERRLG